MKLPDQEISEWNPRIAEFDGNIIGGAIATDYKYDYSWNELMPLVQKIANGIACREFDIDYQLLEESHCKITHLHIYADIETVWREVVKFINWYSNNYPNQYIDWTTKKNMPIN